MISAVFTDLNSKGTLSITDNSGIFEICEWNPVN